MFLKLKISFFLFGLLACLILVILAVPYLSQNYSNYRNKLAPLNQTHQTLLSLYIGDEKLLYLPPSAKTHKMRIKEGQTLMQILLKAGADRTNAFTAIKAMRKLFNPRDILKNTEIIIYQKTTVLGESIFDGFEFSPNSSATILVRFKNDSLPIASRINRILKKEEIRVKGYIDTSLYFDATKTGLPAEIVLEFIRLFSWDVDFQREIRRGDEFDILVNRLLLPDGSVARWTSINYASLTLRKKKMPLYRYESAGDGTEYFNRKGRSARKALMKTPINGARLSSRFGKRRHPILGYTKFHRGVDFAAPIGTPIYAAGDGVVIFAGRKGGYGNYIKIRHNSQYSTAYAHLQGFKRNIKRGKKVKQGQVIGFVGSTGRSTGPHLHYEILVNEEQINPLRIKLPSGKNLLGSELKRFQRTRDQIDLTLRNIKTGNISTISK